MAGWAASGDDGLVGDFGARLVEPLLDAGALAALGPAAMALARAEGLEAHRLSAEMRLASSREPAS